MEKRLHFLVFWTSDQQDRGDSMFLTAGKTLSRDLVRPFNQAQEGDSQ
jgi:hypothetical protein